MYANKIWTDEEFTSYMINAIYFKCLPIIVTPPNKQAISLEVCL